MWYNAIVEKICKGATKRCTFFNAVKRGESVMEKMKKWLKCAGIRAIKTVAQTAGAIIGASKLLSDVPWAIVFSASALAGILSLLTSIGGLPELKD